jgi:hypothetical protein
MKRRSQPDAPEIWKRAASRALKMPNPELAHWFDVTAMEVGAAFDRWRKGGPFEEVQLAVGTLGVLATEMASRTW